MAMSLHEIFLNLCRAFLIDWGSLREYLVPSSSLFFPRPSSSLSALFLGFWTWNYLLEKEKTIVGHHSGLLFFSNVTPLI